jgi:hypothetical protein
MAACLVLAAAQRMPLALAAAAGNPKTRLTLKL